MAPATILARISSDLADDEQAAMARYFPIVTSRMAAPRDSLIIGRHSVLPYYRELETDLAQIGSKLINSFRAHRYIADVLSYTMDLDKLTAPTWDYGNFPFIDFSPDPMYDGYVLKGETNSRKFLWDTHMFAKNVAEVRQVYLRLLDDSLISTQRIYVRRRAKLKTFMIGLHGLPITNEYRTFVAFGRVLATGFYWSSHAADIPEKDRIKPPPEFLEHVIECVGDAACAYTIDTALCENNEWLTIELNDLQMAGISECDPEELYSNLKKAIPK